MAAPVDVVDVKVLNHHVLFQTKFLFTVTITSDLELDELDWTLVYVGDSKDVKKDQILAEISVGPVGIGKSKFYLEGVYPDHTKIKIDDLLDVTVVFLKGEFKDQEFIRVGYYLYNFYEQRYEHKGQGVNIDKVRRVIYKDLPRIHRSPICWDTPNPELPARVSSSDNIVQFN